MILITGGFSQGKRTFAEEKLGVSGLVADGASAGAEEIRRADLLIHYHLLVKRQLERGLDPQAEAEKLAAENPDLVITVTELGCGIVPADAFDRRWRECTGRCSCLLAEKADAVYRVLCGIGTRIR